jgi:hypothetical protein
VLNQIEKRAVWSKSGIISTRKKQISIYFKEKIPKSTQLGYIGATKVENPPD